MNASQDGIYFHCGLNQTAVNNIMWVQHVRVRVVRSATSMARRYMGDADVRTMEDITAALGGCNTGGVAPSDTNISGWLRVLRAMEFGARTLGDGCQVLCRQMLSCPRARQRRFSVPMICSPRLGRWRCRSAATCAWAREGHRAEPRRHGGCADTGAPAPPVRCGFHRTIPSLLMSGARAEAGRTPGRVRAPARARAARRSASERAVRSCGRSADCVSVGGELDAFAGAACPCVECVVGWCEVCARVSQGSPALSVGFTQLDLGSVGPRRRRSP